MTTTLKFGQLRTGVITDVIDITGCSWTQPVNASGEISGVQVEAAEVRSKELSWQAPLARTFLAIDVDGRLRQAGPLWSNPWDGQTLTLGAGGLWSLFDYRMVLSALKLANGLPVQQAGVTVTGASLGGIARQLVTEAMAHLGGDLPLDFGAGLVTGDHTEDFPGYSLLKLGDQLRQITTRATGAPDIRFTPQYTSDQLGIRWLMETGDDANPLLTQAGDDWVFDASAPQSPVVKIASDGDGTVMAERAWWTGNGSEEGTLIGTASDRTLLDAGFPLMEAKGSGYDITEQATVDGHAGSLLAGSARPVETWKVTVRSSAVTDVLPGHYARVVPDPDDAWLGPRGEQRMRIASISGGLDDDVVLTMYSQPGQL